MSHFYHMSKLIKLISCHSRGNCAYAPVNNGESGRVTKMCGFHFRILSKYKDTMGVGGVFVQEEALEIAAGWWWGCPKLCAFCSYDSYCTTAIAVQDKN